MFAQDKYAKVWAVEDKGNYSVVELSTSQKNKKTDKYETDFSSKFVRFIGTAHELSKSLTGNERIKLGACGVTNSWDKDKQKGYTNFLVFSYDLVESAPTEQELPY